MVKQPILLAILLLINSFSLSAQKRDAARVKENATLVLNKNRGTSLKLPYQGQQKPLSNGAVSIYAVVVGIGDYSAMPKLQYTDDDARLFYEHLKSNEGGALPESHIRLLVDRSATRQNILQAMRKLSAMADANDVFVFYFSGHGIKGSFLPYDFDGFRNVLQHEEILQTLENSRAKQKLCIVDACFSGALESDFYTAKGSYDDETDCFYSAFENTANGTALLLSSNPGEMSMEDRRLRHGVFTYFVLKGMSGAADFDRNRIVTIQELFHYTYHYVAEYTEGTQTPVLSGDYDNRMPVAFTGQNTALSNR